MAILIDCFLFFRHFNMHLSLFIFLLLQNKNTFENQDEKLESEEDFQSIRKKRVKPIVFDSDDE